jgi:hypothetical protein
MPDDADDKLTLVLEELRALRADLTAAGVLARPAPKLRYTPNPAPPNYTPLPSIDVTRRNRHG